MAGLYIHIPFCKKACHYCNFHFSTSLRYKDRMVAAITKELTLRHTYPKDKTLSSVYLGGGTPSLLDQKDLDLLFSEISMYFTLEKNAEITLEANPDDLSEAYLSVLADSPVNRLSIGVQSFWEADLQYMNRAHTADEALRSIKNAQKHGFYNLTIDLIYATPTMSMEQWTANIQQAVDMGVPHISCYCLTVEPQTALAHFVKTGKSPAPDDVQAARQFEVLIDLLEQNGYEHYEISNFAKPHFRAKHNSNYWLGETYLGIGPSAHSFDGTSRQWNIAHNQKYMQALERGDVPFEKEVLTPQERYNEYVMTSLRTAWGCAVERIASAYRPHFIQHITPFIKNGTVVEKDGTYTLTKSGKLLADHISMSLFL